MEVRRALCKELASASLTHSGKFTGTGSNTTSSISFCRPNEPSRHHVANFVESAPPAKWEATAAVSTSVIVNEKCQSRVGECGCTVWANSVLVLYVVHFLLTPAVHSNSHRGSVNSVPGFGKAPIRTCHVAGGEVQGHDCDFDFTCRVIDEQVLDASSVRAG